MKPKIIPPVCLLISLVGIVMLFFLLPEFNYIVFPYNLAGIAPLFAGFLLVGKARDSFRKHNTTHDFNTNTALITDGIFSKTRNPVYLGMTIFVLGFSLIFSNVLGLFIPLLLFIIINVIFIPYEERKLVETFSNEYLNYKSKVRMWL